MVFCALTRRVWMKLIDKYLLREYLVPLVYCLCGFMMLYIVSGLFDKMGDFIKAGVSFRATLGFFGKFMFAYADQGNISFLVTILPVSLLCGALYSLSKLTRQNELTALCASGVSLSRLMVPFVGVGVVCSLISVCIQEFAAPGISRDVDTFIKSLGQEGIQTNALSNCKFYNSSTMTRWQVERFDPRDPANLSGVEIKKERSNTFYALRISADSAEWRDGRWWFNGMKVQEFLPDGLPKGPPRGLSNAPPETISGLAETPDDLFFAFDGVSAERYSSSVAVLRWLARSRQQHTKEMVRQCVDAHTRLAMPWACVIATLLAIPAGVRGGRQGVAAGIVLAVVMFIGFYLTKETAVFFGKKEIIWPWLSAWFANIVFFLLGTFMILRIKS